MTSATAAPATQTSTIATGAPSTIANAGTLEEREVVQLQSTFKEKHAENGKYGGPIIALVITIAGIWIGLVIMKSLLVSLAVIAVGFYVGSKIYHSLRNQDYLNASQALSTVAFKQYLQRTGAALSTDSVLAVYKQYNTETQRT